MAALAMTTRQRVKELLTVKPSDTTQDALIDILIGRWSRAAERVLNRHVKTEARVEVYNTGAMQRVWSLPAYGDPNSAVTQLVHDLDRDWTDTGDIVDADDWTYDPVTGLLYLDVLLAAGPRTLQVTYTAGMADTTANFIDRYEDAAHAVEMQVAHIFNRKDELGLQSLSMQGQNVSMADEPARWLKASKEALRRLRRLSLAA